MKFAQPLQETKLIKRYKRFLADIIHPELGEMTVHCPNTGSMRNCWGEGWIAWILDSHNPKRKYRYTWVLAENTEGELIGVNTHFANEIVYEAIVEQKIKSLAGYQTIKRELKYGDENSRIDIWLKDKMEKQTFIEVKSVTLKEDDGRGYFPDAVTIRGQKHLRELTACVAAGHRAVLFFLVQHSGIDRVSVAKHIDLEYAQLLSKALDSGVEILVYRCEMSIDAIKLGKELDFSKDN